MTKTYRDGVTDVLAFIERNRPTSQNTDFDKLNKMEKEIQMAISSYLEKLYLVGWNKFVVGLKNDKKQ